MPTYYGYNANRGGFSAFYSGNRGKSFQSKTHKYVGDLDELAEGVEKLDNHDETRKGRGEGAPAVGVVMKEPAIEGISREAQRIVGASPPDINPTSSRDSMKPVMSVRPLGGY